MANFKVHARVLDLLGEEQIADCPTAMSELFKNAYDAYASKVYLDVYPRNNLAVLWDDGSGMSEDDVLSKWLVVGTPGKKNIATRSIPPPGMISRPVMGEKGIGRLAISTLGDTLFLLTKKTIDNQASYTALLINWNVVRNDRLLLSDIYVPVINFNSIADLESGIADDMVSSFLAPIINKENNHLWAGPYENIRKKIHAQLEDFKLDFQAILKSGISKTENGTAFYISNLAPDLPLYVMAPSRVETEKDNPQTLLVQLLGSFQKRHLQTDVFDDDDSREIAFEADVRSWDDSGNVFRSVFEDYQMFNENDLAIADHHLQIAFDGSGRYSGKIRRYDQVIDIPVDLTKPGLNLGCGPFSAEFWYWQGEKDETRLTTEQKIHIDNKLKIFGGILLYRDDLRVLPYGRPEFDWLKMEERRSLNAGRAFFSYRRMFGSVSISREHNPQLRDKAGREGLKSNQEYRDFRKGLIDFLSRSAKDYFGESADFKAKKAEIEAHHALLEKEHKKVENRRKRVTEELTKRLVIIRSADLHLNTIKNGSIEQLNRFADEGDFDNVIRTNIEFENKVSRIEDSARFIVPSNLSLGKTGKLRKLKHDYEDELPVFKSMCAEIRRQFSTSIKLKMPEVEMSAYRRRTIENSIFKAKTKIGKAHADVMEATNELIGTLLSKLDEKKRDHLSSIEQVLFSATSANCLEQALSSKIPDLSEITSKLENSSSDSLFQINEFGSRLNEYLARFVDSDEDNVIAVQTDEIEELREQVIQNLELVQLGLSVEIIDHDLQKIYRGIKGNIAKLQITWSKAPKSLALLFELKTNFQHLEQRYQLMSPLYRNSYKRKADLTGEIIFDFASNFLEHELATHGVKFISSERFKKFFINEVAARVLPVFINVIDNAIYWTRETPGALVEIDYIHGIVTINDNGPGIHPTLIKRIFKQFVSEKPSGRGLGLHIARANLEIAGHEIWAELGPPYRTLSGACICIKFNRNSLKIGAF